MMSKNNIITLALLILLLFRHDVIFCQNQKESELRQALNLFTPGTRSLGMGGTTICIYGDQNSVISNPASALFKDYNNLLFSSDAYINHDEINVDVSANVMDSQCTITFSNREYAVGCSYFSLTNTNDKFDLTLNRLSPPMPFPFGISEIEILESGTIDSLLGGFKISGFMALKVSDSLVLGCSISYINISMNQKISVNSLLWKNDEFSNTSYHYDHKCGGGALSISSGFIYIPNSKILIGGFINWNPELSFETLNQNENSAFPFRDIINTRVSMSFPNRMGLGMSLTFWDDIKFAMDIINIDSGYMNEVLIEKFHNSGIPDHSSIANYNAQKNIFELHAGLEYDLRIFDYPLFLRTGILIIALPETKIDLVNNTDNDVEWNYYGFPIDGLKTNVVLTYGIGIKIQDVKIDAALLIYLDEQNDNNLYNDMNNIVITVGWCF